MIVPEANALNSSAVNSKRWAVILAGGSGTRLQSLTRRMFGEPRPKQFCNLFGDGTLLGRTQSRIAHVVPTERTLYSVVEAHASYYKQELQDVESSKVLVQPSDRGTSAAIAHSLAQIGTLNAPDPDAIAGFFPADHHFADEGRFAQAVDRAYGLAHQYGDKLLLLGAQPDHPEVEYGWIEPGGTFPGACGSSVFRVNRFWEKPSLEAARGLLDLGCLWNTFVIVGRVRSFRDALRRSVPALFQAFEAMLPASAAKNSARDAENKLYSSLTPSDFSKQVLSALPDRLAVLRLDNVGWSDLGTPERVLAVQSGRVEQFAGAPLTAV
jgi:mannose-1-phosphate guanylyltransferase